MACALVAAPGAATGCIASHAPFLKFPTSPCCPAPADPFADTGVTDKKGGDNKDYVHIRVQQVSGGDGEPSCQPVARLARCPALPKANLPTNSAARRLPDQQRNGKKCLTTVQGLPESYDYKKILKALKKGE